MDALWAIFWLIYFSFAFAVGVYAEQRLKSGLLAYLVCLFITPPLLALLVFLSVRDTRKKEESTQGAGIAERMNHLARQR
jgi:hypothetical protein